MWQDDGLRCCQACSAAVKAGRCSNGSNRCAGCSEECPARCGGWREVTAVAGCMRGGGRREAVAEGAHSPGVAGDVSKRQRADEDGSALRASVIMQPVSETSDDALRYLPRLSRRRRLLPPGDAAASGLVPQHDSARHRLPSRLLELGWRCRLPEGSRCASACAVHPRTTRHRE